MIVSKAKYKDLEAKYKDLEVKYKDLIDDRNYVRSKLISKTNRLDELLQIVNRKGGQKFLDHATIHPPVIGLSQCDIKTLIFLTHPDKHNGKESANRMTQLLLSMRT